MPLVLYGAGGQPLEVDTKHRALRSSLRPLSIRSMFLAISRRTLPPRETSVPYTMGRSFRPEVASEEAVKLGNSNPHRQRFLSTLRTLICR